MQIVVIGVLTYALLWTISIRIDRGEWPTWT